MERTVSDVETFQYDDFFVPADDEGVEELVTMKDRHGVEHQVPIRIKRGLRLDDALGAQAAATKTHMTPKGALVVDGVDEAVFAVELLSRIIVSWPFKRNGVSMKPTKENIRAMLATNINGFKPLIQRVTANKADTLAPFEKPSAED